MFVYFGWDKRLRKCWKDGKIVIITACYDIKHVLCMQCFYKLLGLCDTIVVQDEFLPIMMQSMKENG